MAIANGNGLWKWVSGILMSIMLTGVAVGWWMRCSPLEHEEAIKRHFTDISSSHGMYVIEGRPRIEALEKNMRCVVEKIDAIKESQIRIESKLDKAIP